METEHAGGEVGSDGEDDLPRLRIHPTSRHQSEVGGVVTVEPIDFGGSIGKSRKPAPRYS